MSNETGDNFDEYARYKFVIENIKDVIWEMDKNLVFTFVSPTSKAMVGYDVEELVGRCILDFLTTASKTRLLELWKQNLHKRIEGNFKNTLLYDVKMICKNGKAIWCEVCVRPVYNGNNFTGYIGTTRDISEKKRYENKLKRYVKELKDKNRQLEDLATLDMLTGAYNRRKFEYSLSLEIQKKEKYDSPFSIIVLDVDNFKRINDDNGHENGDRILQDVTALIQNTLRATDKLFRWGGDEFIILLPELSLDNARKVADRVRETIELFDFDIINKEVTVSLGVGTYSSNETPDQFVTRVDNALLKAKFNGKNKVEIAL